MATVNLRPGGWSLPALPTTTTTPQPSTTTSDPFAQPKTTSSWDAASYSPTPAPAPATTLQAPILPRPSGSPTLPQDPYLDKSTAPTTSTSSGTLPHAPAGYTRSKWNDPTHTSMKYTAGRYLAQGGNIQGLAQLLGGSVYSKDKIVVYDPAFGSQIVVDVMHNSNPNTPRWGVVGLYQNGKVVPLPGSGSGGSGSRAGTGSGSGSGGAGTGVDFGGVGFPNDQLFSDPATQALEAFFRLRLEDLLSEDQRPDRDALQTLLRSRVGDLGSEDSNPDVAASLDFNRSRFQELQGDPFTGTEEKALRVARFDRMEQDRAAAKRREADRLMRLGHDPQSGTIVEALKMIDASYDRARAGSENELLLYGIDERQRRGAEAVGLGDFIQAQTEGRSREQLTTAGLAADVEGGARAEDEARKREALSVAALPVELSQNRLQMGLQSLGLGGSPESILNSLLGINQTATAQNIASQQQRASGLGGLGQLLSVLASRYPGSPSGTPTSGA
jgi:hypothetical protein